MTRPDTPRHQSPDSEMRLRRNERLLRDSSALGRGSRDLRVQAQSLMERSAELRQLASRIVRPT